MTDPLMRLAVTEPDPTETAQIQPASRVKDGVDVERVQVRKRKKKRKNSMPRELRGPEKLARKPHVVREEGGKRVRGRNVANNQSGDRGAIRREARRGE
jgi:hypothetical protein